MANISEHQIKAMENIIKHNGITFAIIFLRSFNEIYLVDGQVLIDSYISKQNIIPYEQIKMVGTLIKEGYFTPVDYIKVVNEKYFK